ncbi:alanine aminotransferase 2-like isoform X2 [Brienomyrus brachyistius]|uniref:alanine aminotransferase 2-like isoform X2 n=1 Tax=Brienomyrus brachyistius TaxID=42636 RepID=UPI0020B2E824|nr:alanine aminotransferase 2-like isoform X2 [Brienomyrus brachyistius]
MLVLGGSEEEVNWNLWYTDQYTKSHDQGVIKPYKKLVDVSVGDAHRGGMKPITFVRQVIAACIYPELLHDNTLPADVKERAWRLMRECEGGSVGSYTDVCGIPYVKSSVSDFITRRDGGVPASPENIIMSSGSQTALMFVLNLLVDGEGPAQTGVVIPIPTYDLFAMAMEELGAEMVPYYLCEEEGWALRVEELRSAVRAGRLHCHPRALYVINPSNPTGNVQSRKIIEEVIRFVAEEKLFLMADEVYQDTVQGGGTDFVSYKRVLFEMGPPYSENVQLASFHSVSKGFMGECGLRGGYVELVNVDPAFMEKACTWLSAGAGSAVIGQIALNIMVDPPRPGDPSYTMYSQEVKFKKDTLSCNVRRVQEVLQDIPGFTCQAVGGGIYAFPRLHLPQRAVQRAKELGLEADLLYCTRLLEEEGVCLEPGSSLGQKEGTHHIRLCLMTSTKTLEVLLKRLQRFHLRFLKEFS